MQETDANDELIVCPECGSSDMAYHEEWWFDSDKGYMIYTCKCAKCGHCFESRRPL